MKKIFLLIALISLPMVSHAQATNYNVGDIVDDFTVTDTEGNEHNLYSITASGKHVFLDFFFVDCVPCQTWQPTYNELFDKYGCNNGAIYCLSINNGNDTDQQVVLYEETFGGPFNHAPAVSAEGGGGAVDANFGVNAYPTFCLINPNNEIINIDIWPLTGVETFEAAFPAGFEPEPLECSVLAIGEETTIEAAIFPNPVTSHGTLNVQLAQTQTGKFTVYTAGGRILLSASFDGDSLEIPARFASGTYFLSVESDKGSVRKSFVVR
ncbi:T9SS type A sorting domain-containing protein [Flavobacteriaceae bacterium]|nr:T9SS type A sorting domain-containing protein [Flavobacteriaceae bacterium]